MTAKIIDGCVAVCGKNENSRRVAMFFERVALRLLDRAESAR